MINISAQLLNQYTSFIGSSGVQKPAQKYYVKGLRYYLDFFHKYKLQQEAKKSLAAFI